MRLVRLAAVLIVVAFGFSGTAAADVNEDVIIGFGLSTVAPDELPDVSTAAACQLSVPSGADGTDVLDAAAAKGCINSYETYERWNSLNTWNTYVDCINDVCNEYVDISSSPPAGVVVEWRSPPLNKFHATDGSELVVEFYGGIFIHPV